MIGGDQSGYNFNPMQSYPNGMQYMSNVPMNGNMIQGSFISNIEFRRQSSTLLSGIL